jgi:hypothetical protein
MGLLFIDYVKQNIQNQNLKGHPDTDKIGNVAVVEGRDKCNLLATISGLNKAEL